MMNNQKRESKAEDAGTAQRNAMFWLTRVRFVIKRKSFFYNKSGPSTEQLQQSVRIQ